MGNLLFSPAGRIGPNAFLKGMMILAVIGAVISLTGLVSFQLSQILGYIAFLMVIPLFFILIKRSHDAGRSGWMSIVWFIVWLVLYFIASWILTKVMPSAANLEMTAVIEEFVADGAGLGEILGKSAELAKEYGPQIVKETAIPSALAGLIGTAIAAFLINVLNKQEPNDNRFGPYAGG